MRYLALLLYGADTVELEAGTPEFAEDLARYHRSGNWRGTRSWAGPRFTTRGPPSRCAPATALHW